MIILYDKFSIKKTKYLIKSFRNKSEYTFNTMDD